MVVLNWKKLDTAEGDDWEDIIYNLYSEFNKFHKIIIEYDLYLEYDHISILEIVQLISFILLSLFNLRYVID